MIRHFFSLQFLRFLFVGASAAVLHWLARIFLSLWFPFGLAVLLAYGVGMLVAFFLNSYYVFSGSDKPKGEQGAQFFLINISFLPVVWFLSVFINDQLTSFGVVNFTKEISHGIAVCFPMLITFLLYKFFTFKEA